MSDCPRSELIVDLLEDLLEDAQARREAEAHVNGCALCSEARDEYRQLMGDLEGLPAPEPRAEAREAAHAAVLAAMAAAPAPADEAPVEAPSRSSGRVIPWPLLAAAACLLLALPLATVMVGDRLDDAQARRDSSSMEAAGDLASQAASSAADPAAPQAEGLAREAAQLEQQPPHRTPNAGEADLADALADADALLEKSAAGLAAKADDSPAAAANPPPSDAEPARDPAPEESSEDFANGLSLREGEGGGVGERSGRASPPEAPPTPPAEPEEELGRAEEAKDPPLEKDSWGDDAALAEEDALPDGAPADGEAARRAQGFAPEEAQRQNGKQVAVGSAWEVRRGQTLARYRWAAGSLERLPDGELAKASGELGDQADGAAPQPLGQEGDGAAPQPQPDAPGQQELERVVRRLGDPAKLRGRTEKKEQEQREQLDTQRKALASRSLTAEEAEDLKAILAFELAQPEEGEWAQRVRGVLSLLVGYDVAEQDRVKLKRMARARLQARPDGLDSMESEAPVKAR